MTVIICGFVRFKTHEGDYIPGRSFQNFYVGQTRLRDGVEYFFAPFGITTGVGTKGGDRSDSAIVAPSYVLTTNLLTEACKERHLVEISAVLLDPLTFDEIRLLTTETWLASSLEVTVERSVLRLSSPVDAVDQQVPKRTLNTRLVGSLPATGAISGS